ncbi:hypothetical protein Cci01nite_00160 [Catellatospora citrea]|uniref:Diadenosine tetraphosphate (Ap4A) HIT family hydrolase n=2 Tax=Catellatospora citrea TaxID=53366 RepID=A0A8J3K1G1_9ACTN|nr:diadenosine tetraphosphate (Ap4A) HIT family hydrolase [Catellatospora citrea]GIF94922.1 hypothetical protein Cci01nite_00160 [Catellatospora citrea]
MARLRRRFAAWQNRMPVTWQAISLLILPVAMGTVVYRHQGWALGLAAVLFYGFQSTVYTIRVPEYEAWQNGKGTWEVLMSVLLVFFPLAMLLDELALWQIGAISVAVGAVLALFLIRRRRVPLAGEAAQAARSVLLPPLDRSGLPDGDCLLCRPADADRFFERRRVWEDEHWRLSVVLRGAVAGFAHLESRRHIPYLADLDGPEAATLGPVLARATAAVREATGADKVYVTVFGDRVQHLHFNLAPCHPGGPLVGGAGQVRPDAPAASPAAHDAAAKAVRRLLTGLA